MVPPAVPHNVGNGDLIPIMPYFASAGGIWDHGAGLPLYLQVETQVQTTS